MNELEEHKQDMFKNLDKIKTTEELIFQLEKWTRGFIKWHNGYRKWNTKKLWRDVTLDEELNNLTETNRFKLIMVYILVFIAGSFVGFLVSLFVNGGI